MSAAKVNNDPAAGVYAPRRSQRVANDLAPSDGDIWHEKLAVCEGVGPNGQPKLLIRSFYRNSRTSQRVWDEPPSGAGTVSFATGEMRKKAELQKQELQLTLEMIPPEEDAVPTSRGDSDTDHKEKKKSLFGRFQKKKKERKQVDTAKDLNLQRAIARSMADQHHNGRGNSDPVVYYDGEEDNLDFPSDGQTDDDEMALAKALSMSAAEYEQPTGNDTLSEEEMFQRALEQSKTEARTSDATGVACMPGADGHNSYSSLTESPSVPHKEFVGKSDPSEDLDSKLPALSLDSKPPAQKFDPYG